MKLHVKAGFAILVGLLVGAVAACDSTNSPPTPAASSGAGSGSGAEVPNAPGEPAASVVDYRLTYDWGVPSDNVQIGHAVVPPIAPPPAPPLPYLTGIYAADHPDGRPSFQRISFYFHATFPGYRFGYVPAVNRDGQGGAISLPGNSFLQLVFVDAQAHDESGRSTVMSSPAPSLGFSALKGYGPAGDHEGHVTYGLGIQVAANSDQVRKIRVGELKRADGPSSYVYVVFVDIQS